MTEKLSEFKSRVARLQTDFRYSHDHAVWHAMLVSVYGATDEQKRWAGKMLNRQGSEAVNALLYADDGADAFLRAAIAAGVLLDDTAPHQKAEVWHAPQTGSKWLWISPYIAFGDGLDMARIDERDGKFRPAVRVGDTVSTGQPVKELADAQAWLVATIGRLA